MATIQELIGADNLKILKEKVNTNIKDMSTRIDNLVLYAGDNNAEVVEARTMDDGTSFMFLKDRLNFTEKELKSASTSSTFIKITGSNIFETQDKKNFSVLDKVYFKDSDGTEHHDKITSISTITDGYSMEIEGAFPADLSTISTMYHDKTLLDKVDQHSNEIGSLSKKISVTPDDFEGTDIQKVQAAYDYCTSNGIRDIKLNRTYDITGGSIKLPSTNWIDEAWFYGGSLIKNDAGYMFTRDVNDNGINAPRFYGVYFEGDSNFPAIILDGDRMIRSVHSGCKFDGIALCHTTKYTQSLRVDGCEMHRSPVSFIKSPQNLDIVLLNNKFETSPNHLLEATREDLVAYAITSGRIEKNVIEGYSTVSPIKIGSAIGLSISENYFELNKVHIEFVKTANGLGNVSGKIVGNSFFNNSSTVDIKSDSGNNLAKLRVEDNSSNIPNDTTKSFMSRLPGKYDNNNLYSGGYLIPSTSTYAQVATEIITPVLSTIDGTNGLRVKINNFMRKDTPIKDILGMSYFVNISATHRSTTDYRASYTGILSIIGDIHTGTVKAKVMLTHLNKAGTDALGDGGLQGSDANIIVKFFNANSDGVPVTTTNESIVIDFTQLKYTGTPLIEKVYIKPMENILLQSSYYIPKY